MTRPGIPTPFRWGIVCSLILAGCTQSVSDDPDLLARLPEVVDFNYHVRPLLSDRCYACHGPDEATREAGLRLDTEEGALAELTESPGHYAIRRGSLRRSELVARISSDDPEIQMPPPESNLALNAYEVALLKKWVQQGAEWEPHWAFLPPENPVRPAITSASWAKTAVDTFVLARLEREGIAPAPEADREVLLRRVTMDLTGLPPTPAEIDAFLADTAPDAYERVVDRLLDTPAHAERLAVDWMDLARYADSHGYHADGYRLMWPWRDWVIQAFRDNMPYDQFVSWQLAGDLYPDATREQVLATAFNRNHQMTAEGGIVDEEYRLEYVADRTNTFGQAFLGITMECARCHDHKFDPITQREYYQLSAFFNNVKEVGMTGDDGNAGPMLPLIEPEVETTLAAVRDSLALLEEKLTNRSQEVARTPDLWSALEVNTDPAGLMDHVPVERISDNKSPNTRAADRPANASGDIALVDGPRGKAAVLDFDFDYLELPGAGFFERYEPFTASIWAKPQRKEEYAVLLGNAGQKNSYWRGYEVYLDSLYRVNVRIINALPHNYVHVRTTSALAYDAWNQVALVYDGSSKAAGVRVFVNGAPQPLETLFDRLYKSILPVDGMYKPWPRPVRVGKSYRAFGGNDGIFHGQVDDIRFYDRALSGLEVEHLFGAPALSDAQRHEERLRHYLSANDPVFRAETDALRQLRQREHTLLEPVMEVMVMEDMPAPRTTHVLNRGAYNQPLDPVEPGTPEAILAFDEDLPRNRLGLAQWLFSPENPLTARVAVNRYWMMYFGRGLVDTPEDFGYQGLLPSHPALLDLLARRFVDSGWDLRALQRLIVTSATYRQDSRPRPELLEIDPENTLLARGPSYRLPAEMIRDNALAASGLLVATVGGASAKPYMPDDLWFEKNTFSQFLLHYVPDTGDGLYRRSLYTFLKRTSPHPAMLAFDATDRSTCTIRRHTTNTPLQALILLNDPQFVEASRKLAERMMREGGEATDARITHGFRLLTGRRPTADEVTVLAELFEAERQRFRQEPAAAGELLAVGDAPRDTRLDTTELAALTVVANTIMNHDASFTKR